MTAFENELRKCSESFSERIFVGRAMLIPLNKASYLKMEFINTYMNKFEAFKLTIIDKSHGEIDSETILLEDIWGMKIDAYTGMSAPYIWIYDKRIEWNIYQPTPEDFSLIENQIIAYAQLYMEQEQEQDLYMTQQM